jgi:hypothetical protein
MSPTSPFATGQRLTFKVCRARVPRKVSISKHVTRKVYNNVPGLYLARSIARAHCGAAERCGQGCTRAQAPAICLGRAGAPHEQGVFKNKTLKLQACKPAFYYVAYAAALHAGAHIAAPYLRRGCDAAQTIPGFVSPIALWVDALWVDVLWVDAERLPDTRGRLRPRPAIVRGFTPCTSRRISIAMAMFVWYQAGQPAHSQSLQVRHNIIVVALLYGLIVTPCPRQRCQCCSPRWSTSCRVRLNVTCELVFHDTPYHSNQCQHLACDLEVSELRVCTRLWRLPLWAPSSCLTMFWMASLVPDESGPYTCMPNVPHFCSSLLSLFDAKNRPFVRCTRTMHSESCLGTSAAILACVENYGVPLGQAPPSVRRQHEQADRGHQSAGQTPGGGAHLFSCSAAQVQHVQGIPLGKGSTPIDHCSNG